MRLVLLVGLTVVVCTAWLFCAFALGALSTIEGEASDFEAVVVGLIAVVGVACISLAVVRLHRGQRALPGILLTLAGVALVTWLEASGATR